MYPVSDLKINKTVNSEGTGYLNLFIIFPTHNANVML